MKGVKDTEPGFRRDDKFGNVEFPGTFQRHDGISARFSVDRFFLGHSGPRPNDAMAIRSITHAFQLRVGQTVPSGTERLQAHLPEQASAYEADMDAICAQDIRSQRLNTTAVRAAYTGTIA